MNNTNFEQDSLEWLKLRLNHIGSSDIAVINETNPWKSPYVLWLEETSQKEPDKPNKAMEHGKMTEPRAREKFMIETEIPVVPNIALSKKWDVAMASLDGITLDLKTIVEIKCPLNRKLLDFACLKEIPPYYFDQMQWQLWVTGSEKCIFFVYLNDTEFEMIDVYPDVKYQEMLVNKAKAFWYLVKNKEAPSRNENEAEYINNPKSNDTASQWRYWKEKELEASENRKALEEVLKRDYTHKSYFPSAQVQINWIERKGSVNWKAVQKTWCITEKDLEDYRNNSTIYSTISIID